MPSRPRVILLAACVAVTAACASQPPRATDAPQPSSDGATLETPDRNSTAVTSTTATPLLAVGDIGDCTTTADEKVADVVRSRKGKVALLGDIAYERGTPAEFANCFDPAWGTMGKRLRPAPGNHEYLTPGAAGYFSYFGLRAGPAGKGWYVYDVGPSWRAIVLNSACAEVGGCGRNSEQGRWLAEQLAAAGDRHVLAYWHTPRYSSGKHGPNRQMKPFFSMLYQARAAIVLAGHEHMYERFAPQNAVGERRTKGVQQFTVGTGGRHLYSFGGPRLPNTRARNNTTHGVLRLLLRSDGYSWQFLPVQGSFTDKGSRTLAAP
jgi:hypothetical protein